LPAVALQRREQAVVADRVPDFDRAVEMCARRRQVVDRDQRMSDEINLAQGVGVLSDQAEEAARQSGKRQ
jgi:hypothetical protein